MNFTSIWKGLKDEDVYHDILNRILKLESLWTPVKSSNIDAVLHLRGFFGKRGWQYVFLVRFHNGTIYTYEGVPSDILEEFFLATSKGEFFHDNIRNKYPYLRVT